MCESGQDQSSAGSGLVLRVLCWEAAGVGVAASGDLCLQPGLGFHQKLVLWVKHITAALTGGCEDQNPNTAQDDPKIIGFTLTVPGRRQENWIRT